MTGDITALRQQLDALDLEPVPGNPGMIRDKCTARSTAPNSPTTNSVSSSADKGENEKPEMTIYEIPLEHDFISKDAEEEASKPNNDSKISPGDTHRKMAASDFQPITCLGKGSFGTVHLLN